MNFMLLIHQGTTPVPPSREWDALSEQERSAIGDAYRKISETPGRESRNADAVPRQRHHGPREGREDDDDRRAVR